MYMRAHLYDVVSVFSRKGFLVTVRMTEKRGDATLFAAAAKEEGYDLVVCCGGDGTLNEVISGIMSCKKKDRLPIGYIPAGSTNDFAKTLGLSFYPYQQAELITRRRPSKIDIGWFCKDRYFTYIATFGIFSAASYEAPQELKNTFGHIAYLLEGLKDLTDIQSHRVHVTADGKEFSGNYIFGSVSNTRSVGGIVKLDSELVDLKDGLFELLLVKNPTNPSDLSRIMSGVLNSDFSDSMFEFVKASEVTFNMGKSVPWSLDGEKAEGKHLIHVKNIKAAITMYM